LARWFLILIVVWGAIFLALANWSKLRVNQVVVEGAQIVKSEEIIVETQTILAGQLLPLVPKNHLWWYPAEELQTNLLTKFPRLATVKTFAEWPGRLSVVVTEREPALLYCGLDKCAFIDPTGRAYAAAPTFSPGVFLTWTASSTLPALPFDLIKGPNVNRLISSQKIFNKVFALLKLPEWRVNQFEQTLDNDFIFWVEAKTSSSTQATKWRILINQETSPFDLGENLHTALSSILEAKKSAALPKLDYVDLRFGKKVFYKL
jgi:hypothetical protein